MAKIKLAVKLSGSKKKNKVEFNFIFILIEKKIFWKYPKFFGVNSGANQNFIAHAL